MNNNNNKNSKESVSGELQIGNSKHKKASGYTDQAEFLSVMS